MTDLFRLDDATAVLTGASGWLGAAMVDALHDAGATVHALGRDTTRLRDALGELADSPRVQLHAIDVTTNAWPALLESLPRIDVLVNNAHVGRGGSMRTATDDNFDEAFELAVKAAWRGMTAARAGLAASVAAGGSPAVINVASMYGLVAPDMTMYATEEGRNPPFYGAAKAALLQLSRYAAAELGPEGIRVNAITPGPFPALAAQANGEFVQALKDHTLTGTVGAPEDIKTALLFLASPHSRFVTGANIVVDGGWTAR
ncbi:SDR family NAD(P)-dependent oxidoreductase [Yimella sp. cx-51]|uniref:SDR family NAD(P)-dependent oxidoreductase n=1 Tax=Yimella sp. cx-51 TaxID=2770551 RepID=UPI00165D6C5A|nr:SDR family oxidoreductase [Yimella sp. cx-51]MBC9958110.1 SDR family oxidoreductase [Yimella sp. cx-51]QTH38846.1 SDR family oxidoreductase [Yimella sp. cx-51]